MKENTMVRCMTTVAAAAALIAVVADATAQPSAAYPTRPIRLLVPVPPGGSSDGMARIVGKSLTERWSQQVLVDNRPGAAEVIGTELAARAAPDGYTLVLISIRHSVNPSLLKLPYDPVKDFEPVTMTAAVGNVLVVNANSPIRSVKDVIAMAKEKPGALNFASSGIGGAPHLIGEFFALNTGVKLTHIPYKGGGPAIADLLSGTVSMSFASMTSSLTFIRAGRLRPLAVSSKERSAQLPEVQTMAEAGVPNTVVRDWQGILAPRRTPKALVDKLAAEIGRTLRDPANQERFAAMGLEIIASSPQEFGDALTSEIKRWAKVVQDANIKAE